MNRTLFSTIAVFIVLLISCSEQHESTITISGKVTDFEGNPIDSSAVGIFYSDFSTAYETFSDSIGNYELKDVKKGKYMALYAMREKEYPRPDRVPDSEKRLEYWAWNIVADKSLTINPRYHRLELYGTNIFRIEGGYSGFMVYVRPMSLGKYLSYPKDMIDDKSLGEKFADISVTPENFEVKIYANEQLVKINSIQKVEEFVGIEKALVIGYLIHIETTTKPEYPIIFRIEGTNLEYNEKGENIYFYESKNYEKMAAPNNGS